MRRLIAYADGAPAGRDRGGSRRHRAEVVLKALGRSDLPAGDVGRRRPSVDPARPRPPVRPEIAGDPRNTRDRRTPQGRGACGRDVAGGRARRGGRRPARGPRRHGGAGGTSAGDGAPQQGIRSAAAGHRWPGHTEMLAEVAGVSDVAMLFVGGTLRVALVTIHRPRPPVGAGTRSRARRWSAWRRGFSRQGGCHRLGARPRAASPFARSTRTRAKGGLFGREEIGSDRPRRRPPARSPGPDVSGPFPADSLFARAAKGEVRTPCSRSTTTRGSIPVKLASFGHAVQRDDRPAVRSARPWRPRDRDSTIVERGIADEASSLLAAIRLAADLVSARR